MIWVGCGPQVAELSSPAVHRRACCSFMRVGRFQHSTVAIGVGLRTCLFAILRRSCEHYPMAQLVGHGSRRASIRAVHRYGLRLHCESHALPQLAADLVMLKSVPLVVGGSRSTRQSHPPGPSSCCAGVTTNTPAPVPSPSCLFAFASTFQERLCQVDPPEQPRQSARSCRPVASSKALENVRPWMLH